MQNQIYLRLRVHKISYALIPLLCLMLLSKFLLNTFHPRSTSMKILVKRISTLGCEPRQRQAMKEGAERFLQWL